MSNCGYELCRNWAGSGCVCDVLELDPDIVDDGQCGCGSQHATDAHDLAEGV